MSSEGTSSDGQKLPRSGGSGRALAVLALALGAATLLLWPTIRTDAEAPRSAPPKLTEIAQAAAAVPAAPAAKPGDMTMEQFLDRLMVAESGGRDDAANPRSTAVGPFQFIEATWLDVMRRHFPEQAAKQSPAQLLALRVDRVMARKAAEAFTRDNAAYLQGQGLAATFPHLRLAFLVGPHGAARVLQAPSETRVAAILGPAVANANPFMFGMTAAGLVARSARDIATDGASVAGGITGTPAPRRLRTAIPVQCNLALPSCRRWLSLAERKVGNGRRTSTAAESR